MKDILNLVLPVDQKIPENFPITSDEHNIKRYDRYLKDRVLFVRALETGAVPSEMGIDVNYRIGMTREQAQGRNYTMKLKPCPMSTFQAVAYDICEKIIKDKLGKDGSQALMMVYPDGNWGNGFTVGDKRLKADKKALKDEADRYKQKYGIETKITRPGFIKTDEERAEQSKIKEKVNLWC